MYIDSNDIIWADYRQDELGRLVPADDDEDDYSIKE